MEEEKVSTAPTARDDEENEEFMRKQIDFPLNMWGSLESIRENTKKGANILEGVINFTKTFHKAYDTYQSTIEKALEIFEKEMLKFSTLDTTMICMSSFCAEMKNMLSDMKNKLDEFDDLLYHPSQLFVKHYQGQSKKYYDISKKYLQEVEAARQQANKAKDRYFKHSDAKVDSEQEIEKRLQEHEDGIITFEQMQEISNKALNVKYKTEVSFQEYKQEVEYLNNLLQDAETEYNPALTALQKQEERRIDFVKYMMEKFLNYYSQCGTMLLTKEDKFNDSVKMINHHTDLQIFVDENRTKESREIFFSKVEVNIYEPKRNSNISNENGAQSSTDASSADNDPFGDLNVPSQREIEKNVLFVKDKIKNMIRNQSELTMEDKADILNLIHLKEVNFKISEELKTISDVKEYHVLKDLSDIVNYMITESINDKHNDFKIINNILMCSSSIFCRRQPDGTPQAKKAYLTDLIRPHAIWGETNRWKTWIYCIVEEKKNENINKKKKQVSEKYKKLIKESEVDDPNASMMSKWLSRLHHEKRREIEKLEEDGCDHRTYLNIIFNVLSTYLRHLSQFNVPLDVSKQIILYFCERYDLDKDRTQLILSELESTYSTEGFTEIEIAKIRLRKREILMETLENDSGLAVLYHVSNYLDSDKDLLHILSLNKSTNQLLKPIIYRRCLLNVRHNISPAKRSFLWNYFLKLSEIKCEYIALRDRINENPEIIEKVEEVITLDVQRSFNNTEMISRENLSNILKTYAFYNPEIEYCQGMNFLAGFFYFYYKDEEKAFKAMLGLINKFDLTELFNTTLPRLKLYFYVLDRLISMYLPELHEHFKNEYITSSLFSSAWFITCFCNTISHQNTSNLNNNILFFWDNFVIDGYVVIFKVAIVLLGLFEDKLLPLSFEEILNYIIDIPKILFSKNETIEEMLEPENIQDEEDKDDEGSIFEQSPLKKGHIKGILKEIDFASLLKDSPVSEELIQKIELEYKENENKGNFN
ncbi:unnamed protein product [Moneuplotes crassus]|uniref:Rab-GAP TBC domain-containing protein n=2 Tax=Euplotes crassus TaxID=5936 RepID=A0AAD2D5P1_EUPCR|nr:unnamed protein product [Moneuplotes crassus]